MPGFPVLYYFPELLKFMSSELVTLSNHVILILLWGARKCTNTHKHDDVLVEKQNDTGALENILTVL